MAEGRQLTGYFRWLPVRFYFLLNVPSFEPRPSSMTARNAYCVVRSATDRYDGRTRSREEEGMQGLRGFEDLGSYLLVHGLVSDGMLGIRVCLELLQFEEVLLLLWDMRWEDGYGEVVVKFHLLVLEGILMRYVEVCGRDVRGLGGGGIAWC